MRTLEHDNASRPGLSVQKVPLKSEQEAGKSAPGPAKASEFGKGHWGSCQSARALERLHEIAPTAFTFRTSPTLFTMICPK